MWSKIVLWFKNLWNLIFSSKPSWVDVEGYEGIYQISDEGEIFNLKELKTVSTFIKKDGYECVALTDKNGKAKQHRVHRLVATHFLNNDINGSIVTHVDGNKLNNEVTNLKWL